jgi:4a-hydroxytetrahydrobiopterin dehydratase
MPERNVSWSNTDYLKQPFRRRPSGGNARNWVRQVEKLVAQAASFGTDVLDYRAMPVQVVDPGRLSMSVTLADKTCTPCRGGIPPLTPNEAEDYRAQAPEWVLQDDATRIERSYKFKNFAAAFTFVCQAGELAETEAHHPDISFGWGYATVSLRTKKIKGLHENDFIMAVKLDRIAAGVTV